VYGLPDSLPLTEASPITKATNPYGSTKLYIEQLLCDAAAANPDLSVALLRYFNPAGAHASGDLGEDPSGIPNNLLPYITQVAVGKRDSLTVHGDDYKTPDGTCIRDYIHVMDLAQGHVAALDWLDNKTGAHAFNLGTGQGHSVLEVIKAFEHATNLTIPYQIGARRPGDIEASFTDPAKAQRELGWRAEKTLLDICRDAWNWQQKNPDGYE
ncbi:MAG: UDP-glucose 4-epimerase GalE, partial [Pseudomonadales bacterium]